MYEAPFDKIYKIGSLYAIFYTEDGLIHYKMYKDVELIQEEKYTQGVWLADTRHNRNELIKQYGGYAVANRITPPSQDQIISRKISIMEQRFKERSNAKCKQA